ncbi:MAG: hypothetical protein WDO68_07200 [Gammaproteobacteria bacterium]
MTDLPPERVQQQLDAVLGSELLAKSETSRKLLSYLAERSARNEVPKETEIAFDVFGKDPSFSGAEHSIVRVSVRTLRQKLAEYYAGPGREDELRFDIPKGGYRLTVTRCETPSVVNVPEPPPHSSPPSPPPPSRWKWAAAAACAALVVSLATNIYLWSRAGTPAPVSDPQIAQVRDSELWSEMVKSNRPVTLILGDLFMFTQTDPKTGRTLMVRDAGINSSEELRALLASNPSFATERGQRYVTMLQKTVAVGMASILRIIDRPGRRIEVVAQDDVSAETIRNNDVIYLGPMVRLGALGSHYALQSRYRYSSAGSTITDVATGKTLTPEGTLSAQHVDYALAAKFIGPTGNNVMIFTAGARNAGVLQIVRTVTSPEGLAKIESSLRTHPHTQTGSFEALLTVTGFKQTDLAAEVINVTPMPAPVTHLQTTAASATPR